VGGSIGMADLNPYNVDIEIETIRGRACPQCGGKIIPSNRALYQSAGDPADLYPLWECERCGYTHMSEKPKVEKGGKAKH
jgi:ribosomal protein S27AE